MSRACFLAVHPNKHFKLPLMIEIYQKMACCTGPGTAAAVCGAAACPPSISAGPQTRVGAFA